MCDFFDEKGEMQSISPFCCIRVTYLFLILARCGIFVQRVATWRMEYGKN